MDARSQLGYLQTRLQARHGERLGDADWRLLEATPDLAGYLQAARATSLRRLIGHLPTGTDPHTVERSLRHDWRMHVEELVVWSPDAWRPAVAWWSTLPDLTPLIHLARGERVISWMRHDPAIAACAQVDLDSRARALEETALAPVLSDAMAGKAPLRAWIDHWFGLLPAGFATARERLMAIAVAALETCGLGDTGGAEPQTGAAIRSLLMPRFVSTFRRFARTPVAIFAYLGLSALDYERLRAGLALRAAFPDPARRPRWA